MPRKNENKFSTFWQSAKKNKRDYNMYYDRFTELAISMFEWKNLPPTIDERFMELALFGQGSVVFFKDEVMGFLALRCTLGGEFDVYNVPIRRRAYASNGYQNELTNENSVIIWNNQLHTNTVNIINNFADVLYEIDTTIRVNAKAQKTPIVILADETQRLTMKNLYMKYEGNEPFIFGDKSLDLNAIKVLNTNAPYNADKLYNLKSQYWNEAMTFLGISNTNIQKKERLISDEVLRNQGGTIASRYSRLEARRQACKAINEMFGLDVWCDFREDYQNIEIGLDTIEGEPNSDGIGGSAEAQGVDKNRGTTATDAGTRLQEVGDE